MKRELWWMAMARRCCSDAVSARINPWARTDASHGEPPLQAAGDDSLPADEVPPNYPLPTPPRWTKHPGRHRAQKTPSDSDKDAWEFVRPTRARTTRSRPTNPPTPRPVARRAIRSPASPRTAPPSRETGCSRREGPGPRRHPDRPGYVPGAGTSPRIPEGSRFMSAANLEGSRDANHGDRAIPRPQGYRAGLSDGLRPGLRPDDVKTCRHVGRDPRPVDPSGRGPTRNSARRPWRDRRRGGHRRGGRRDARRAGGDRDEPRSSPASGWSSPGRWRPAWPGPARGACPGGSSEPSSAGASPGPRPDLRSGPQAGRRRDRRLPAIGRGRRIPAKPDGRATANTSIVEPDRAGRFRMRSCVGPPPETGSRTKPGLEVAHPGGAGVRTLRVRWTSATAGSSDLGKATCPPRGRRWDGNTTRAKHLGDGHGGRDTDARAGRPDNRMESGAVGGQGIDRPGAALWAEE